MITLSKDTLEAEEYLKHWMAGDEEVYVPELNLAMDSVAVEDPAFAKQVIEFIPGYIEREPMDWPIYAQCLAGYAVLEENRGDPTLALILQKALEYKKRTSDGDLTMWHVNQGLRAIIYSITGELV